METFFEVVSIVWMYIQERRKINYLTKEIIVPRKEDLLYATWDAKNSMLWHGSLTPWMRVLRLIIGAIQVQRSFGLM